MTCAHLLGGCLKSTTSSAGISGHQGFATIRMDVVMRKPLTNGNPEASRLFFPRHLRGSDSQRERDRERERESYTGKKGSISGTYHHAPGPIWGLYVPAVAIAPLLQSYAFVVFQVSDVEVQNFAEVYGYIVSKLGSHFVPLILGAVI